MLVAISTLTKTANIYSLYVYSFFTIPALLSKSCYYVLAKLVTKENLRNLMNLIKIENKTRQNAFELDNIELDTRVN